MDLIGYSKQTQEISPFKREVSLTNREKAVLLLASLDKEGVDEVMSHLSTDDLHKVNKAFKRTRMRQRDYSTEKQTKALESFLRYGMAKRFDGISPELLDKEGFAMMCAQNQEEQEELQRNQYFLDNMDSVVAVLRQWMAE